MQYALVASNNIVQNIIAYDEDSDYTPPTGLTVMQVNDWITAGDVYNAAQPSNTPTTDELLAALDAHRDTTAAGGTTISGVAIQTDPVSRANLMGAYLMAQINPSQTFDWDTTTGYVTLTGTQIIALTPAVGAFVQKCFTVGKTLTDAIANYTDIATLLAAFDTDMKS